MATRIWKGGAQAVQQETRVTFGTINPGKKVSLKINNQVISVEADVTLDPENSQALLADVINKFVDAIGQYSNEIPEWAEVSAVAGTIESDEPQYLRLLGPTDGKPVTIAASDDTLAIVVSEWQKGSAGKNKVQLVQHSGTTTAGTFTLTWNGQTTAGIAYNAAAAAVQSALEALSNIDVGDVSVTGTEPWRVEFTGRFARVDVPLMTANGASLTKAGAHTVVVETIRQGGGYQNTIQMISHPCEWTAGQWVIGYKGATYGTPMNYNATVADVQAATDSLLGAGNTVVRGETSGPYYVEFIGALSGKKVVPLEVRGNTGTNGLQAPANGTRGEWGGRVQVERIVQGSAGSPTTFEVTPTGDPWSFAFIDPDDNEVVQLPTMPADATAAEIANAFNAVNGAREAVFVRNSDPARDYLTFRGGPWLISIGGTLAGRALTPTNVINADVEASGGDAGSSEVQRVRIMLGQYEVTHTSGALTWNVGGRSGVTNFLVNTTDYGDETDLLTCLSNAYGAGWQASCTVTRADYPHYREFTVTWQNNEGNKAQTLISASVASTIYGGSPQVDMVQEGDGAVNELQRVSFGNAPGTGNFTLTGSFGTTGNIAFDASAATVEAALIAVGGISSVSGPDGGPWLVEFIDALGGQNINPMTGATVTLGGSRVLVDVAQEPQPGSNEIQLLRLMGNPTGGTFTLTYGGQTTGALPYNASPLQIQRALQALSSILVPNVLVRPNNAVDQWLVEFVNTLGNTDVAAMTAASSLTTGSALTVTTFTTSTGPYHANNANNWSGDTLPVGADTVVFENGDIDCLYGLDGLSGVTLAELHFRQSYTGNVGLEPKTESGYREYRTRALTIGATLVVIGQGEGIGSSRIKLNTQAVQTTVYVYNSGLPASDLPAVCWKGTHASNIVRVQKGSVGIAIEAYDDAANVSELALSYRDTPETDADVRVGKGIAQLTTIKQTGGNLVATVPSTTTITTFTKAGGTTKIYGEGPITTFHNRKGRVDHNGNGTLTTVIVGPEGEWYRTEDFRGVTYTNTTCHAGAVFQDPFGTITFTNPIILSQCGLQDVDLNLGTNINIQRT